MARKSARSTPADKSDLGEEIQATREVLTDGLDAISPTVDKLAGQVGQLARDLFDSPLGRRAQRHPVASLGIASVCAIVVLRLFRR